MISLQCSSCKRQLGIREEHAGKQVKCPGCGQVLVAPHASDAPRVTAADPKTPSPVAEPAVAIPGNWDTVSASPKKTPSRVNVHKELSPVRSLDQELVQFLAPALSDDEIGRLGKYRVLRIIGRGGMGVIYEAEDTLLRRRVALKVILPSLIAGDHGRKRFLREARAMAQLDHDHVVRLYEVNEEHRIPYIAMELLSGQSLAQALRKESALPLADILRIGRETAEGLAAAHARGLVHRDIKPANLFLAGSPPRVKILDFGLVSAVDEESRLTDSGVVLGTPAYMAPEQGRGEKVDFRCDLFSLGVVLYRLCMGINPFEAADGMSTMLAIANLTPPTPQGPKADMPADLSHLIMRLLEKQPARRGTAHDAAAALACIERGEPAPAAIPVALRIEEAGASNSNIGKSDSRPPFALNKWTALIVAGAVAVLLMCVGMPLLIALVFFR